MAASQPNCPLVQDLEQQSNSPCYALRILMYRACSIIPTLVLLWPPISVGTTTSIVWVDRLMATYVHLCRTLAFRHNMHGMAIRRFFVAFIRPCLEYCTVWCGASPALLKDLRKSSFEWQERSSGIRPCVSTFQQARLPTLSWRRREHCLGFLWQLSIGKGPALQSSLVPCAQLRSNRFPHSFRFPSPSSSRHLSLLYQTCPHREQAAFFCHLFYVSLSSFRSVVRRYLVSDMFSYGLS